MTRSPMTALGRTRPRNLTKSGVLSAEKMINGKKRVAIVPSTTAVMVIICCVVVIVHFPRFRVDFLQFSLNHLICSDIKRNLK